VADRELPLKGRRKSFMGSEEEDTPGNKRPMRKLTIQRVGLSSRRTCLKNEGERATPAGLKNPTFKERRRAGATG